MSIFILLGLLLVPVLHVYALVVSRRGKSAIYTAAFWGGIIGLISVPVAIMSSFIYLPFSFTGPGDHAISWIAPATLIGLCVMVFWSLGCIVLAKRRAFA